MKVTVCQLRNDPNGLEADWHDLLAHVQQQKSELVLLPEMPFSPWPFWEVPFTANKWHQAVAAHEAWTIRMSEMAPAAVVATRPLNVGQHRYNQAFSWDPKQGQRELHIKAYLPDETGFWEASWYERGGGRFRPATIGALQVGVLICTELWFMQHARDYGQAGIHLLLTPRATEQATTDKWLAGGRAAAVIAGAYGLSSNLVNDRLASSAEGTSLGGRGWVVDPEGRVLAETSPAEPFVTVEIDPAVAEAAKTTYPRYVSGIERG